MTDLPRFYERFIEPIEPRMMRSVWRITRNNQDAEDAMQNALLALWKRRHRINRHLAPQALVLKICVQAACDVARRRARDRRNIEPQEKGDHVAENALSPGEDLANRELTCAVLAAVNRLPRGQAVAFTLRVFEELPYEEIAAALGCAQATARKHVERARTQLRAVLRKHAPDQTLRS
jgi:RNA polymerase sigma-70 factor, ECF subfamily